MSACVHSELLPLYGKMFAEAEPKGKEAIGELICFMLDDIKSCDELVYGQLQLVSYILKLMKEETSVVQREYLTRELERQRNFSFAIERRCAQIKLEKGIIGTHFVRHYQKINDF